MPELPEVETIRKQLNKFLVGHVINDIEVRYKKCVSGDIKDLKGGKIVKINRFGKALSIDLNNNFSIVIHIKMTGQLIYRGPNLKKTPQLSNKIIGGILGKHTHVVFYLDKRGVLYYNDLRKFGWIKVVKSSEVEKLDFINKLGPEPFKDLDLEKFNEIVKSSSRPIKSLLMDQGKIAGVGNIYANDALWLSKINPERISSSLKTTEQKSLFSAIERVLKKGLKNGGASENSYVTPDGTDGNYQKHFLAYGREGEICARCKKGKFKKIKTGGRGTYYCPVCQQ